MGSREQERDGFVTGGRHHGAPSIDEFDGPAEVEAAFRTQRRVAAGYFVVFLLVTLGVPTLSLVLGWWSHARLLGGMSPSFLMAAFGLYVVFFVLALLASSLADAIEDRMLGATDLAPPGGDEDQR